ncbi:MAG: D-ornithine 4,5-aminomutase subunit OraS [Thermoleophilia bacterium]|jgi:D-ornithine 4,5-aminomutase subunit alpha|nr:D-ornithine 4,5-aminomutase subunit OraS [Thermoleophilia bacterium]
MTRADEYLAWRTHLADLSDEQLEARFWELVEQVTEPLVELARTHTSPSIERSVLMRMGVDSPTGNGVVNELDKRGLLGHGAGHVVLHCAQRWDVDVRAAAARLAAGEGWRDVERNWGGHHGA